MDYRLKRKEDFDLVFHKGTRVFANNLTLVFIKSDKLKIGYSVGKKHGGSVERNRIKRLLRASFFEYRDRIINPCYIVFVPKPENEYSFKNFNKSMEYVLKKSGLIK